MNREKIIDGFILVGFLVGLVVLNIILFATNTLPFTKLGIGIVIATALTLFIYSFLYKDNPLFKMAEHLFVGIGLGISVVYVWLNYLKPELYQPLIRYAVRNDIEGEPNFILLIPAFLGLFLVARLVRKIAWLSRWSFAFLIGGGAGLSIPLVINSYVLKQLEPSLQSLFVNGILAWSTFDTLLILIGVVSVLIYFFFSLEHKGVVGGISRVGIWFLMISFGASFGYTVMGRMALLIQRIQFMLTDWLKITVG